MPLDDHFSGFSAPASRNEYHTIKQQLEVEKMPGLEPGDPPRSFHSLTNAERAQVEKKRLSGLLISLYFFIKTCINTCITICVKMLHVTLLGP
jgi:DNA polymerase epsilon subunit 1